MTEIGKSNLKSDCDFARVVDLVSSIETDRYLTRNLVCAQQRITPHLTRDPTFWYGEKRILTWLEEIWTKGIDAAVSSPTSKWFVDSEVPCKGGQIDLIIIDPESVTGINSPRIAILEVKVGNERAALRHAVYYAIFVSRIFPDATIRCGVISVPKSGDNDCDLSPGRISNYLDDCKRLEREQKNLFELKTFIPMPLLVASWSNGALPEIESGSLVPSRVPFIPLSLEKMPVSKAEKEKERVLGKGKSGKYFIEWLFNYPKDWITSSGIP